MTNHRRVAVLGGSFNPIHVGHMIMAENALVDLDLDEVIFAPAGDPPHKDTRGLLAADVRLAMVQLATENRPGFRVSTMDIESSGPSFTWRLLERMLERESATQFWFLMGGDSVRDFPTWRRPERILELARLAVVERPGFLLDLGGSRQVPELPYRADVIEAPLCDVSSTDIRNRITSGRSIRYLVPESVRSYIEGRSLFHDTPTGEETGGRPAS